MHKIRAVRQDASSLHKLWFNDSRCDLFVWRDADGDVVRFQFCYGKPADEHVAEWRADGGFAHMRVDDGEAGPWTRMTPIFVRDGVFDPARLAETLRAHASEVPRDIVAFVSEKLLRWDGWPR
ncbi:MAG: hypothetical protein COZ06_24130 [Armatimonadetes bacterium CG_4_10_14_3_um_filter_66_18]|nr:hypothetical protein [Armatimonadota bacterium]OIO92092.1 MAG: hypothetical protein AUJ96_32970 [Armatimonadetes bacterium CG2_30_66_41]PIU90983.1 MAG: hypothetical protein COS65_23430 [Armatimonadetes bacterium CG06_land_8_20_14_3_00_66_21]PIX46203.1 MAG: hypothetical protein COZ57_13205 [Armatimonadetes bacterium CG_4_8_14_3_um_filter_66_20]PIY42888.1 MAG: hypothetical protein COZ06_24130 [Armatimonadetes bacterium CG_4_10_14_3_um_filter_66_18]PIZ50094.1 MAG: hypothetical protein COY42_02